MENNHNWNGTPDGADPQDQWQHAANNEDQWQHADDTAGSSSELLLGADTGQHEDADEALYASDRDGDPDDEDMDDDDDDDNDDDDDGDDDDDDDADTDWGNVDPQSGGLPSDMDPSGPGSAV